MTTNLPTISIVTPSLNQRPFLRACLESVLSQGYPALEYIVMDGGSTDESVALIEEYAPRLSYWVSEKDTGQANAINRGLARSTGDIWTYLNADDELTPGALEACARAFAEHPDADVIYGDCVYTDKYGHEVRYGASRAFDRDALFKSNFMLQPSTFLRRSVLDRCGGFDESLHYVMDLDYWLRVSLAAKFVYVPRAFSRYRLHGDTKSARGAVGMVREATEVKKKYGMGIAADYRRLRFALWGRHRFAVATRLFGLSVEAKHLWRTWTGQAP